jgi:FKBP-type peptidyl-prolyl cis-trans isomerase
VIVGLATGSALACDGPQHGPHGTIAPPDVSGPPADAVMTTSGLAYRVLSPGANGPHPGPNAIITVNYTGWMRDGTIVDGAPIGSNPVSLRLNEQMAGWREGVQMMVAGEKRRFWIPAGLAYGGRPGKLEGPLVYDIYLVRFVD